MTSSTLEGKAESGHAVVVMLKNNKANGNSVTVVSCCVLTVKATKGKAYAGKLLPINIMSNSI